MRVVRFALGCFTLLLTACTDNEDPGGAKALWQELHADPYRSFTRAPGYEQRRKSEAPHGGAVDIYVNDVVQRALVEQLALEAWPDGSLIVKDGWDGSELELVAAMKKVDGRWFWAEYDGEGDALYSGTPELCTECHLRGDDFVRALELP
jgi:hypothetical protein